MKCLFIGGYWDGQWREFDMPGSQILSVLVPPKNHVNFSTPVNFDTLQAPTFEFHHYRPMKIQNENETFTVMAWLEFKRDSDVMARLIGGYRPIKQLPSA